MSFGKFMLIDRKGPLLARQEGELTDLKFILPQNGHFSIGIDQSTTCTGFYLTDREVTFHLIGDMYPAGTDRHWFYLHMKSFVRDLVEARNIDVFVLEKPLPYGSKKRNATLVDLFKTIKGWKKDIPELGVMSDSMFASIAVPTWKKHIVDNSKGKGRTKSKRLMAEDLVDTFPELKHFLNITNPDSDHDAFDAAGILHGYRKEFGITYQDGVASLQKIGGSAEFTGHITVFFVELPEDHSEDLGEYLQDFKPYIESLSPEVLRTDNDLSWYINVRKAVTISEMAITQVEDPQHRIMLQWLKNFKRRDSKLIALIFRKSSLKTRYADQLRREYAYEDVTW